MTKNRADLLVTKSYTLMVDLSKHQHVFQHNLWGGEKCPAEAQKRQYLRNA